ncbi:MAG: citrate synthase [Eubacteriaceae bacterium]|nr:citrate synthase [Eubacteriaceae bacterium]
MKITPEIRQYSKLCLENDPIESKLFKEWNVYRGLRDNNGVGVLTGLTHVSDIYSKRWNEDHYDYFDGVLKYRGLGIEDLVNGFMSENRFGFEEISYLLMFGKLPSLSELEEFKETLVADMELPQNFVRDVIMKSPTEDIMNSLARSVLMLHNYDKAANDTSIENVVAQSLYLISVFPMLAVYSYNAYRHYIKNDSMIIHRPDKKLSTAENILRMLRPDKEYTYTEAKVLDMALVLHAEHGGGNNSTFTTHVVTSTGTDTYSAIASALCSLKGPRHGGASLKVTQMFADIEKNVKNWDDEGQVRDYLLKIKKGEAFDRSGLIYGVGHAVYAYSDPRAKLLKKRLHELCAEKHNMKEFALYNLVEKLAPGIVEETSSVKKPLCVNVDFYSGLLYKMLGIPKELYCPMFAVARITGWSAHRCEEIINSGKIIRPAYENVCPHTDYIPITERQ